MDWFKIGKDEIISSFGTSLQQGLTNLEVQRRLKKFGLNELKEEKRDGILSKIIAQFSDFLVIILIIAAFISGLVGEIRDSIVILTIVIVNASLGIYQEGRAEKALEALQKMASPNARVIRDGHIEIVPANTLVPGDLVIIEAGDIIPADLRLMESFNLKIEEASLSGESVPVEKNSNSIFQNDVPLGDRANMAYMSTIVTYGRGKGVVVETGHKTEIGRIATIIQTLEEELTPLQKNLNQLGKYLGIITIAICFVVFGVGLLQGRQVLEMFLVSISLAVAAIPEGLPAIVTIVLAIGMNRMVKQHAIVKKLLAVETLGSTTVICSDKTGTLTQNEMTVVKIFTDHKIVDVTGSGYEPKGDFKIINKNKNMEEVPNLSMLLSISILTNDANIESVNGLYKVIGDPTEGALITLAGKGNLKKEEMDTKYPRINEIPFDSDRKMMTTFHKNFIPGKIVSFTKGAPDIIIKKCEYINKGDSIIPFNDIMKNKILDVNSYFAKDALRVLAFAYKEYEKTPTNICSDTNENGMTFVGLVGMIDPARPEAKDSIKKCKEAGIRPLMITGDYKETAFAIAKDLGIAESINEAIMGEELNHISDNFLKEVVKYTNVYARVSPEHKVRIVSALKENGEVVAMTGDGVNDAMALKRADIGVSMGITGTDVAKNTAEVILTDDNFASIVSAVEQGRIIYSNIKKFVFFLLSCNIGEIFLVFASILMNLPVPLLPIQLLWLNLVTDSFPALALGVEEGDVDIMEVSPRKPGSPIIDNSMMVAIIIQSIAIGAASLIAYVWALKLFPNNLIKARTITFSTLITAELIRAFASRSEKYTLFEIGLFSNMTMIYATSFSFLLLLAVLYIPILQPVFHTTKLNFVDWGVIISFALFPYIIGELYKVLFRKNINNG